MLSTAQVQSWKLGNHLRSPTWVTGTQPVEKSPLPTSVCIGRKQQSGTRSWTQAHTCGMQASSLVSYLLGNNICPHVPCCKLHQEYLWIVAVYRLCCIAHPLCFQTQCANFVFIIPMLHGLHPVQLTLRGGLAFFCQPCGLFSCAQNISGFTEDFVRLLLQIQKASLGQFSSLVSR